MAPEMIHLSHTWSSMKCHMYMFDAIQNASMEHFGASLHTDWIDTEECQWVLIGFPYENESNCFP